MRRAFLIREKCTLISCRNIKKTTMAQPRISYAAVLSGSTGLETPASSQTNLPVSSSAPVSIAPLKNSRPSASEQQSKSRIAMISGYIDLSTADLATHYAPTLEAAILRGDSFIVSTSAGADSMCLAYLREKGVPADRIGIYTRREWRPKPPARVQKGVGRSDESFRREGYVVKQIQGNHTQRDEVMTAESDYDILWVRSDEETKKLYGARYRPGRVSGTEKNRLRRIEQNGKTV
jgi:hypothetical protein